jgi:hypothetical protein
MVDFVLLFLTIIPLVLILMSKTKEEGIRIFVVLSENH